MHLKTKGIYGWLTLAFGLTNAAVFVLYYLFNHISAISSAQWSVYIAVYIVPFIASGLELLMPLVGAAVLLITRAFYGTKYTLLRAIPLSVMRIFYLLPYYYLYFVFDGYSSIEALLFGLLSSIPEIAVQYALMLALFVIMRVLSQRRLGEGEALCQSLSSDGIFRLEAAGCFALFGASLCAFAYLFVRECIDTVSFLIEYSGSYTVAEIIFITVSFLLDFALLFLYHICLRLVCRRICCGYITEDSEG